jgi:DNA polymerase-3 subunit epsilon
LKNSRNELIFIGKSRNIKKRVQSHLNNSSTKKATELREATRSIAFEETGSELIALLKEEMEINNHCPLFNKIKRKLSYDIGLFTDVNSNGYITFSIKPTSIFETPIVIYNTLEDAREELFHLVTKFNLDHNLSGLTKKKAEPTDLESLTSYNTKAESLIKFINPQEQNFIVIDKGRNDLEKSVVYVANNVFCGIGYIATHLTTDNQALKSCIVPVNENKSLSKTIKSFLVKHKVEQVIYLK